MIHYSKINAGIIWRFLEIMYEQINRRALKAESRALLTHAQISPHAMTALYLGLILVLNLISNLSGSHGALPIFIYILTSLMALVLEAGFVLYCMAIRRGERAEFLTLFDGFSFAGKLVALNLMIYLLICCWSILLIVPGFIAAYRYRFALLNLCGNPELGVLEALELSKRQTYGFKWQLFLLDLSYLGWKLLSALPVILYNVSFYIDSLNQFLPDGTLAALAATLILGVWQLLIAMLYYPHLQCTELAYFELAGKAAASRGDSHQGRSDTF